MTPARGVLAALALLSLAGCADEYATVDALGGGIHEIRMERCRPAGSGVEDPAVVKIVRDHVATVAGDACREGFDVLEQVVESGVFGNAVAGSCRTVKLDARIQCREAIR